jgi:membrane-bound metal-dependent hydrolase YbcI (DUF457 family)
MPTGMSHAIVALALGPAFRRARWPARVWWAAALCAAVPDADVLGVFAGVPIGSLLGHRGLTHSLAFAAALAAVLTQRLLERAAAWGTAFPSSHVAASLVASVSAWRGLKPLGAPLVVLAVLLTLGTVYGQFHYAVDALAGAALAAAVLILDPRPERGHRVV